MLGNVYCSLFYIPRLNMLCLELRKCRFPVLRFFLRIRTECSEHVNSFVDAY